MANQTWEFWLERVYNLRRDKRGSHEQPHKPVLLQSIIDLLDRGVIRENAIPLSDELVACFKRYFAVVKREDDQPTIQNPFFHLSGDRLWQLVPRPGQDPIYRRGATSGAPSVAELRRRVVHGTFDAGFWPLMSDGVARHQLREALVARYFPSWRLRTSYPSAWVTTTSRTTAWVQDYLTREQQPSSEDFNIGVNDGPAAGQTMRNFISM